MTPFLLKFLHLLFSPVQWPLLLTLIFINSNVSNIFPPRMKKAEVFIINLSVVCVLSFPSFDLGGAG